MVDDAINSILATFVRHQMFSILFVKPVFFLVVVTLAICVRGPFGGYSAGHPTYIGGIFDDISQEASDIMYETYNSISAE